MERFWYFTFEVFDDEIKVLRNDVKKYCFSDEYRDGQTCRNTLDSINVSMSNHYLLCAMSSGSCFRYYSPISGSYISSLEYLLSYTHNIDYSKKVDNFKRTNWSLLKNNRYRRNEVDLHTYCVSTDLRLDPSLSPGFVADLFYKDIDFNNLSNINNITSFKCYKVSCDHNNKIIDTGYQKFQIDETPSTIGHSCLMMGKILRRFSEGANEALIRNKYQSMSYDYFKKACGMGFVEACD